MPRLRVEHERVARLDVSCVAGLGGHHAAVDQTNGVLPDQHYIVVQPLIINDIVTKKNIYMKNIIVNEVLPDGDLGKKIEICFYRGAAIKCHNEFGTTVPANAWLVLRRVLVAKHQVHQGPDYNVNSIRVGIGYSGESHMHVLNLAKLNPLQGRAVDDIDARVSPQGIPQAQSPVRPQPKKTLNTTKLKYLVAGKRYTIMAVIGQVIKESTVTSRGTYHLMLGLVDPSCRDDDSPRQDVLLHVFINDRKDNLAVKNLPGGVHVGDVVLVKQMATEMYAMELTAKVYSAGQIVKFSVGEAGITHETLSQNYSPTDEDIKRVIELREWWMEQQRLEEQQKQEQQQQHSRELLVCDVVGETVFDLICQVVGIWCLSDSHAVLRVRDGTRAAAHFVVSDAADSMNEVTQNLAWSDGMDMVDISVSWPYQAAQNLHSGDYVRLCNVQARIPSYSSGGPRGPPALELVMTQDPPATINTLTATDDKIGELIARIEESFESASSQHSVTAGRPVSQQGARTPVKPSPNRINSQPLTPGLLHRSSIISPFRPNSFPFDSTYPIAQSSPIKNTSSLKPSYSPIRPTNSPVRPITSSHILAPSPLPHPTMTTPHKSTTSPILPNTTRLDPFKTLSLPQLNINFLRCQADSISCTNEQEITESQIVFPASQLVTSTQINPSDYQAKGPGTGQSENDADESKKDNSNSVYLEVEGDAPLVSIEELLGRETSGLYKVHAKLNSFFTQDAQCEECKDEACHHNWVWGICEQCSEVMSPQELRLSFSMHELHTPGAPWCRGCQRKGEDARIGGGASKSTKVSLAPFVRLAVELVDGHQVVATLHGDHANQFFGIKPSFSWLVGKDEVGVTELVISLVVQDTRQYVGVRVSTNTRPRYTITRTAATRSAPRPDT